MGKSIFKIGLGFLFVAGVSHAQALQNPVKVQGIDIMTWPSHLTADQVLSLFVEMASQDPNALSIYNKAVQKLNQGGVANLETVFSYCPLELIKGDTKAYFLQNTKTIETRISVPGVPLRPWSENALAQKEKAFGSKIIRLPFTEYLAINENPRICIHKVDRIFFTYDPFIHELVHFIYKDSFSFFEEMMSSKPMPDFVHVSVQEPGGELQAFQIGNAAGIRMLKNYGITNYKGVSYKYFNANGVLTDKSGLQNHLIQTYTKYYGSSDAIENYKKMKRKAVDSRLDVLKINVEPVVTKLNDPKLSARLKKEIEILEELKSQLN